jgi:hypothetical protein
MVNACFGTFRQGEGMDNMIGLVAVIMTLGIPLGGMYTYYHVRKLRSEERLAAIARGVEIPMEPELSQGARSRRWGILLVTGAIGYIAAFGSMPGRRRHSASFHLLWALDFSLIGH